MFDSQTATLLAAFVAGLAGSAHCFAMCGGIAGALGMHARAEGSSASAFYSVSSYQIGRIGGYGVTGAVCGLVGAQMAHLLEFAQFGRMLRVASGVLILLLGVRLLWRWNALQWIERVGAHVWAKLRPLVRFASDRKGAGKSLSIGLLWSLLPCGLVYSMLLLAAMSADPGRGALIMLAFGAGTVPSMLSTSLLAARLQAHISSPTVRIASGVSMLGFGAWMLALALNAGTEIGHAHH